MRRVLRNFYHLPCFLALANKAANPQMKWALFHLPVKAGSPSLVTKTSSKCVEYRVMLRPRLCHSFCSGIPCRSFQLVSFLSTATMVQKRAISTTNWLDAGDKRPKRQHLLQTGEWITQEPLFQSWKSGKSKWPILWVHGPPGCGKTHLVDHIVHHLEESNENIPTVSYFCDAYSHPASMARSFAGQLLRNDRVQQSLRSDLAITLETKYAGNADQGGFREWDSLLQILKDVKEINIVIDGLDEISKKFTQESDSSLPTRLINLVAPDQYKVKLLVSSRTEPGFQETFKPYSQMTITAEKVNEDLSKFIENRIETYPQLQPYRDEIIAQVLPGADGIFLWAGLFLEGLTRESNVSGALRKLDSLPPPLADVYTRILQDLKKDAGPVKFQLISSILGWTVTAIKPMRLSEIMNGIFVESNMFVPDLETTAVELCGSLVKYEDGLLKAVHHTLREFLLSKMSDPGPLSRLRPDRANADIARTCLRYLSNPAFSDLSNPRTDLDDLMSFYPFLEYSTLYWVNHLSLADKEDSELQNLVQHFFQTPNAFVWADEFLPALMGRSVIPAQPRPPQTARFLLLFTMKSQILKFFSDTERSKVDSLVTCFLRDSYTEALENARTKSLEDPLNLIRRLMNLSEVYSWLQGERPKTAALMQEALQLSSRVTALEDKPLVVDVHQGLANVYKIEGKYEDAKKILEKLMYLIEECPTPQVGRMMFALDSLGWVKMRLGELEGSAKDLQAALDAAAICYGSMSPTTLRSKMTLAEVLSKLGRLEEADALCTELKAQLREHMENGIPLSKDSISQMNTMAAILMAQGNFKDAVEAWRAVVQDRRKIFGEEHGMTIGPMMQLAIATMKMDDLAAAKGLFDELLPKQQKVLGTGHPDVRETSGYLESLANLDS